MCSPGCWQPWSIPAMLPPAAGRICSQVPKLPQHVVELAAPALPRMMVREVSSTAASISISFLIPRTMLYSLLCSFYPDEYCLNPH